MRLVYFSWMMALATLSGAENRTSSGTLTPEHVLRYIPPNQNVAMELSIASLQDVEMFQGSLTTIENRLNRELQERKITRVARVFGPRLNNLRSILITGSLHQSDTPYPTRLIWALTFRKSIDLPNILSRSRTGVGERVESEIPFIAEMMNGKVVFFHKERGILVYQVRPKLIFIGQRELIKQCTRIADPSKNTGNDRIKNLLTTCARGALIKGAILSSASVNNASLRFELHRGASPMVITYSSTSAAARNVVLNRFRTDWQPPESAIRKAFPGKWIGESAETGNVVMTLPFSEHSANYLMKSAMDDTEFIEALAALARVTSPSAEEPANED